jgi:hypothetical protein
MKVCATYRGFQEPRNHRLARGVEPLGIAALLAPTDGAEDEPELAVAASSVAFFTIVPSTAAFFFSAASSMAFFTAAALATTFFAATASSMDFFTTATSAASFSTSTLVATAVSSAAELLPDPPRHHYSCRR